MRTTRCLSAIVVAKQTAWNHFVEELKDPHMLTLIARNDPSLGHLRNGHETHMRTFREVKRALESLSIKATHVMPAHQPFDSRSADVVITVGGDGTLLAASHHVGEVPLLGVNSAPGSSVGFFCGTGPGEVEDTLCRFVEGKLSGITLTRMEVIQNDQVISRRVLNDALLCHSSPAATSRYILELGERVEEQRSSGFWVGPAAGSTAAQRSAGGRVLPLDSPDLQLVVREPYIPQGHSLALTREVIPVGWQLRARSKMYDAKLFLDGPHTCINVARGDSITFRRSSESITVLGMDRTR